MPAAPERPPARREPARPRRRPLRDPRIALGLAITAGALWIALRGVDPRAVWAEFRAANLALLLGLSVPGYLLMVHLRALRWRHLTDPIQPMPAGALFRAVAVGFMANNVFPLRIGELVRSWYLGRETRAPVAAVFGTVVLERVIDALTVILLALAVLVCWGGGEGAAFRRGVALLVPLALAPVAGLFWLHRAPDRALAVVGLALRPLPAGPRAAVLGQLRRFGEGLGALRGGAHLFWIGIHTLLIWLVASTLPILAAFLALGVDLGGPARLLAASWMTLAAIGIAVALPSAPGFFGVYHSACRLVLEAFGLPAEMALALGTLCHAVFWLTLTLLGLAVLRSRATSLADLDAAVGR